MNRPLLTLILAALGTTACNKGPWVDTEMCLDLPASGTCPAAADIDKNELFSFGWCAADVKSVEGEATLQDHPFQFDTGGVGEVVQVCCFPVVARDAEPNCAVGRPFLDCGEAVEAPLRPGNTWSDREVPVAPGIDWLAMARMEHASVASFARLTLELLALGAPPELLADVQRAAADEVEHARVAFSLAAATGTALEPGALPIGTVGPRTAAEVAAAAVREGCMGETLGAFLVDKVATNTVDPALRKMLQRIADDEARHAALSWKIVAWLMRDADAAVLEAVQVAFAEPFAVSLPVGMASEAQLTAWIDEARRTVLEPARAALAA